MTNCGVCKQEITSKTAKKYCGKRCAGLAVGQYFTGKRMVPIVNCLHCSKELSQMQTRCFTNGVRQKYCSASCQMNYEYAHGLRDKKKITEKANEHVRKHGQPKLKGKIPWSKGKSKEDTLQFKKMSENRMGENNPMYGKTPRNKAKDSLVKSRYIKHPEWLRIKKLALIRDNFICQSCGIDELQSKTVYNGQPLQVHHLVPYRVCREHKLNNLITLCCSCHSKATVVEMKEYAEFF